MTPKQAIFYGEYIKDGNATRAAIVAGCPESSAHVAGARLLRSAKVAAAVEAWRERQAQRMELTAERVLDELWKLATFDPGNLYDKDGNRIPVARLDDVTRAAVASVEDFTTEEVTEAGDAVTRKTVARSQKLKMADKGQNLERLGRYFKLFTDRVESTHRLTLEDLVCSDHPSDLDLVAGGTGNGGRESESGTQEAA